MSNKWKIFWVVSLALVILFQACGMHSLQEFIVSKDDERKMGEQFNDLVKAKDPNVLNDGEELFVPSNAAQKTFMAYYEEMGKKVTTKIRAEDWKGLLASGTNENNFFKFQIIKSKQVNAFAVPGGYVYFYTPILSKEFETESELMGVIAHEIGHIVLHHSRDRMVKSYGASVILDALLGDGLGGFVAGVGANFWLMQNNQDDEFAADSMGYYYTNELKISSAGLSDFFDRGLEHKPDGTCEVGNLDAAFSVFSTHPPSCERVTKNKERMKNQNFEKEVFGVDIYGKTYKQLVDAAKLPILP